MSARLVLSTATPATRDGLAQAAALAVVAARGGERPALLVALEREPRRRPATLLASPAARELEAALREAVPASVARGHFCLVSLPDEPSSLDQIPALAAAHAGVTVAQVPPGLWQSGLELGCRGGLLRAEASRATARSPGSWPAICAAAASRRGSRLGR